MRVDRAAPRPAQLVRAERVAASGSSARARRKRTVARRHEHVDLVAERGQALGDRRAHATDPPLVPGTIWSIARVEDPHFVVLTSSAKNGPDVMRPNSSRSSFIANDSRAQRRVGRPRLPAMRSLAASRASRTASASAVGRLQPALLSPCPHGAPSRAPPSAS